MFPLASVAVGAELVFALSFHGKRCEGRTQGSPLQMIFGGFVNRRLLSAVVAAVSAVVAVLPCAAMDVIKDGKPVARIVLPAETEHELAAKAQPQAAAGAPAAPHHQDEELLAAEELRSILERISGAKLTVERAQGNVLPQGPAILIGTTLARAAGFG